MSNKYSRYINGLVRFINDTKPFHSKLTEVQEVYQFSESMNVDIREKWRWSVMMKAYWLYEYYSDGRSTNTFGGQRRRPVHFINSPLYRGGSGSYFDVNTQQSSAIDFIPNVFDESSYALSDVVIQRNDRNVFIHQGLDYHKSYGAQIFRIRQTHKVGFREWCGKQVFTTSWASDGKHPIIKVVEIPNAEDIQVRSGNAIRLNNTQIKILTPGTVVVDGFVSESYYPLIQEKQDEAVVTEAVNAVKDLAMDKTNPSSCYSRLKVLFSVIQLQINMVPAPNSQAALDRLQTLIEKKIPDDFEELVVYLVAESVPLPSGYAGWRGVDATPPYDDQKYMETVLYSHSPNLMQNYFTDRGEWEYAGISYESVVGSSFSVSRIVPNYYADSFEEWTVTAYDEETGSVSGSSSGIIGSVKFGERFTSNLISFSTSKNTGVAVKEFDSVSFAPINKIVVHNEAPLEAWAIIKTDPFGYSRPVITSTRYAHIVDLNGTIGNVTVLNKTLKEGSITISKISDTAVSVVHDNDERVNGVATIGEVYNDGFVGFTLKHGTIFEFADDELFILDIENIPPFAKELSICYSYDCDAYDAQNAVYNTVDDPYKKYFKKFEFGFDGADLFAKHSYEYGPANDDDTDAVTYVQDFLRRLEFGYDSRFVGYDFKSFNLKFTSEDVEDNKEWRLRAKPDYDKPLKLHADTPSNKFNLISSVLPGDAYAPAVYDAPDSQLEGEGDRTSSDPDYDVDLYLYYSSEFALEYYDPEHLTWVIVDDHVPINERYSNPENFLEFTIVPASKDFIGAEVHSSWIDNGEVKTAVTIGGDCLTWTTRNPFPECTGAYLVSDKAPRILMHSSGFSATDEYLWKMTFSDPNTYDLRGIGQKTNTKIYGPSTIKFDVDGFSYKNREQSIHYTLIPNYYGFDKDDFIRFYTYKARPNYLVYGSVSGWQEPAEYNKYYWNGKIGFKVVPPSFTFYEGTNLIDGSSNTWVGSDGEFKITWNAYNIVDSTYTIDKTGDIWILKRDGVIVASDASVLDDGFISLSVPEDKLTSSPYTIIVDSDDFDYAFGQNVTVMKSKGFRNVRPNDTLYIERSRKEQMYMHISDGANYDKLYPEPLAASYADLTTRQEPTYTLNMHSPEVDYHSNWIPLTNFEYDIGSSISEFRDTATTYDVYSTVADTLLGRLEPQDPKQPLEPCDFVFNIDSHESFLPLNSSIEFLVKAGGPDETVAVGINEKLRWFILGGIGGMDAMFNDDIGITLSDSHEIRVTSNYADTLTSLIRDNNFQGFLPGYDNLPFDAEDSGNGYYDPGVVLADFFQEARLLLIEPERTQPQEERLKLLLEIINPWVQLDQLGTISLNSFIQRVREIQPTDEYLQNAVNYTLTSQFGIPNEGMGTSITEGGVSTAASAIQEHVIFNSKNYGGFDRFGMGSFGFDGNSFDSTVIHMNTVDSTIPTTTSYDSFGTTEYDLKPVIQITGPSMIFNKRVMVWVNGESRPVRLYPRVMNMNTIEIDISRPCVGKIAVF